MEDFVIMRVKNFSHTQNYQNWKDMERFMFCLFFPFTCIIVTQIV